MKVFKKKFYWYSKYNFYLNLIPIVNIVAFMKDPVFFKNQWISIEIAVFLIVIILINRKKERMVYEVTFDDNIQKCTIRYYRYISWKLSVSIPYYSLKYDYYKQKVGAGFLANTLVFKNQNEYVAEIKENKLNQWKDRDLKNIIAVIDNLNIK